jgi:hypothetical protein
MALPADRNNLYLGLHILILPEGRGTVLMGPEAFLEGAVWDNEMASLLSGQT